MARIAVVTDSTASLPPEMYERYGIFMVPYYVHVEGRSHRDMVDLLPEAFNRYLSELPDGAELPRTANPSPGDYVRAYGQAAEDADEIVSFHMTSKGSGAYGCAQVARDMLGEELRRVRIHLVDTRNVSMGHGWLALQAARAAQAGANLEEIMGLVKRALPRVRMLQTADTLRYLYMGGRIGKAQHLVGSLLNIRPLITMEDGVIGTLGVARTRERALERIAELLGQAVSAGEAVRVALTHAAARADAERLLALARKKARVVETLFCDLSPALAVHSGPGTVGLCYYPEEGASAATP
ncbi:MAG: DegV family protein [Chloroflexota bacterium]